MNWLNKLVWSFLNPVVLGLALSLVGCGLLHFKKARVGLFFLMIAVLWGYAFSTGLCVYLLGAPLEREFLINGRMPSVEDYLSADAILDFGGGVSGNTNISDYAELCQGADRAYFSALLWKNGKAPIVIPSGKGIENFDVKFLMDFGVPADAIRPELDAVNTEENARNCARILGKGQRVLLVTSAWHMKRALLMMRKYAPTLKVIPAPCDFEASLTAGSGFRLSMLKPEPLYYAMNAVFFHEWLGYFGYKWFR